MADKERKPRPSDALPRISVTIDHDLQHRMRIAAAYANMDANEWAKRVLALAAKKAVPNLPKRKATQSSEEE